MTYKDPRELANQFISEPEHLENPNDPTDKDWDTAIDAYLNGIDPDLFEDGTGTISDGLFWDIENNGSGGVFFDDNYPNGIPYNKVSDARREYAKNKIAELVNSKYKHLAPYLDK